MAEVTVSQAPPSQNTPKAPVKKRGMRTPKNLIILGVVVLLAAVGLFFLVRFLTHKDAVNAQMQTAVADFGSITSTAAGQGNAKAKETAAITLSAGGTVQEVFVSPGDVVTAGQPLYTIYSQAAQEQVATARQQVETLQKDMQHLSEQAANLTVRAPFSGKLTDVKEFAPDQQIASDTPVATLVNDKKLKLSLYFSYAYENDIKKGQSVSVSIPAVMRSFSGTVEEIHKVSYISPEGAVHFEVVIAFDNPGTLTAGMDASATLTAADGSAIYPYQNGKTEYYETREIRTKAGGPLLSTGNLLNYANVSAGDVLLTMGSDTIDQQIRDKQKAITEAQQKLAEAEKGLANFNAVAPIDGTVITCTLTEGAEVKSGDTVLVISNNTTMLVNITVDDRNISFIKPGMTVELSDYNNNTFMGTVTSINMGGAESSNGMTKYPVTLTVDNADEGAWLNYSFVTSQSENCIVIPSSAVTNISGKDGNPYTVVFIQADSKPENAVDFEVPPVEKGETPKYPTPDDGFYPVPVTTGLSDNFNVEIKEGLQGGETVFQAYIVESAWG